MSKDKTRIPYQHAGTEQLLGTVAATTWGEMYRKQETKWESALRAGNVDSMIIAVGHHLSLCMHRMHVASVRCLLQSTCTSAASTVGAI